MSPRRGATHDVGASSLTLHVVGRQVRWTRRQHGGGGTSRFVCLGAGMDDARVRASVDACTLRHEGP